MKDLTFIFMNISHTLQIYIFIFGTFFNVYLFLWVKFKDKWFVL